MKKIVLLICLIAFNFAAKSQSLGGFPIIDYLVEAVHPNGCDINAVTGYPDDTTWVNLNVGDTMTGTFGSTWLNAVGSELLLETSFHADNYNVRLKLSSGFYSATHAVNVADWTHITDTAWIFVGNICEITVFFS